MIIMAGIRDAIQKSGKSRYRISQESGVAQAVLCKIMAGGTCSMDTAETLYEYLGLEVKARRKKARK